MIRGTFHSLHPWLNLLLCLWGNLPVCEFRVSETSVCMTAAWHWLAETLPVMLTAFLSQLHPDPLTHLKRLCLSNHLFCKMKWQQIKRSSQMVLMCFPRIGPLHAFSSRASHFHVFHSLLCGCSHPPGFNFVYWQTILMKKFKQNQYCFYNESLHSQSCDYPFSQKTSAHTFSLCYGVNCRRLCW